MRQLPCHQTAARSTRVSACTGWPCRVRYPRRTSGRLGRSKTSGLRWRSRGGRGWLSGREQFWLPSAKPRSHDHFTMLYSQNNGYGPASLACSTGLSSPLFSVRLGFGRAVVESLESLQPARDVCFGEKAHSPCRCIGLPNEGCCGVAHGDKWSVPDFPDNNRDDNEFLLHR